MYITWSGGVVVITSALHAEGREFDPRPDLTFLFVALTGSTSVRTAVLKDGHTFMVHVIDPKLDDEDAPEEPTPPPTPQPNSKDTLPSTDSNMLDSHRCVVS